jgi:hypothetical protein
VYTYICKNGLNRLELTKISHIEINKNVDIKFSTHDAFLEELSSGTLKIARLKSQNQLKCLGAIKSKGLNKIGDGPLCPREENLSLIKNYIF